MHTGEPQPSGPSLTPARMLGLEAALLLAMGIPAGFFAWWSGLALIPPLPVDAETVISGVGWALALLVFNAAALGPLAHRVKAFGFVAETFDSLLLPIFRTLPPWAGAALAILAGFGEELIFRWWLQGGIARLWSVWGAIAVTTLLFALVHIPPSRTYWRMSLYYCHFGLLLGWVAVATPDGLARAMVAHGLYDFLALLLLPLYERRYARGEGGNTDDHR